MKTNPLKKTLYYFVYSFCPLPCLPISCRVLFYALLLIPSAGLWSGPVDGATYILMRTSFASTASEETPFQGIISEATFRRITYTSNCLSQRNDLNCWRFIRQTMWKCGSNGWAQSSLWTRGWGGEGGGWLSGSVLVWSELCVCIERRQQGNPF